MNNRFYTIVGTANTPPIIGPCMTEREVIEAAKNTRPSIELPINLDLALKTLNEDGKVFEVFDTETEMLFFIGRAEAFGLAKEAAFITRQGIFTT